MKQEKDETRGKLEFETPKVIATFEKDELEKLIRPHLSAPAYF